MTSFTYGGVSSDSFGIHIEQKAILSAPEYDMDFSAVPGRDGDLAVSNQRFHNATVSYTCFLREKTVLELAAKMKAVKAWLYADAGTYRPLTDSYDPAYQRYAVLKNALDIEEQLNQIGVFTVVFSCKPHKQLISGLSSTVYTASSIALENPEPFESLPVLTVNGTGTILLSVSNTAAGYAETVTVTGLTGALSKVVIDSEAMNCYNGATLMNANVTFGSGFPRFKPGTNRITVSGSGFTSLTVTPRWRCL